MKNFPLVVSLILHGIIIFLTYINFGNWFTRKNKDTAHMIVDFVPLGKKSTAPIISPTKGQLSKTKSSSDEKDAILLKNQPQENQKAQPPEQLKKPENKPRLVDKKKPQLEKKPEKKTPKINKTQPKKETKKPKPAKPKSDNSVVNLQKNKKKSPIQTTAAKKSFDSLLSDALAKEDHQNSGLDAEEVGEGITATEIDLIRQTIKKCWQVPIGQVDVSDLAVTIRLQLDQDGYIQKVDIVDQDKLINDPNRLIAMENATRAVKDPRCNHIPLPKEKYEQWKDLEISFTPTNK
jgi:hypothetical protein